MQFYPANQSQKQLQERRERWNRELDPAVARWEKIGLLRGINDEHVARMVAMCLENQRLINQMVSEETETGTNWVSRFMRLSIPVVRRLFGNAPFTRWVGFQTKLSPTDALWCQDNGILIEHPIAAKTRRLKTQFPQYNEEESRKYPIKLDYEAEQSLKMTSDLSDEISREVITDLCNNCLVSTDTIPSPEKQTQVINLTIQSVSALIKERVGHAANWMVTSPRMIEEFQGDPEYRFLAKKIDTEAGVYFAGMLGHIEVFCDKQFTTNKMLFGYKGDWHQAGYYYMPYVPFTVTPVVFDPDTLVPRQGLMTRYTKYLTPNGHKHYHLAEVANVVFSQERAESEKTGPLGPGSFIVLQKRELDVDSSSESIELDGPGELVSEVEHEPELDGYDCVEEGECSRTGLGNAEDGPADGDISSE